MRAALLGLALLLAGCTASREPAADPPASTPSIQAPVAPTQPTPAREGGADGEPGALLEPPAVDEDPPTEDAPPTPPAPTPPAPPPTVPASPAPTAPASAPQYSGSTGLPVRFERGADPPDGRRFVSFSLGADQGSFAASVRGVAEATLRIDSLARIVNADSASREVMLSTAAVTDPRVTQARLLVGGAPLDLNAAEPNATMFLSPGAVVDVGLEITMTGGDAVETLFQRRVVLAVR